MNCSSAPAPYGRFQSSPDSATHVIHAVDQWLHKAIADLGTILPITIEHAAAQAKFAVAVTVRSLARRSSNVENITAVSDDQGARSIWRSSLVVSTAGQNDLRGSRKSRQLQHSPRASGKVLHFDRQNDRAKLRRPKLQDSALRWK